MLYKNKFNHFFYFVTLVISFIVLYLVSLSFFHFNFDDLQDSNASTTSAKIYLNSFAYKDSSNYIPLASITGTVRYNDDATIASSSDQYFNCTLVTGQKYVSDLSSCESQILIGDGSHTGLAFLHSERSFEFACATGGYYDGWNTFHEEGVRLNQVIVEYWRKQSQPGRYSLAKTLANQDYDIQDNKTYISKKYYFNAASNTETNTEIHIFVSYYINYVFLDYNNNKHSIYYETSYGSRNNSYTPNRPENDGIVNNFNVNDYSRTGYTLTNFAKSNSTSAEKYFDVDNNGSITPSTTLNSSLPKPLSIMYPIYSPNTYTVTLDKNDDSGSKSTITATYDSAMPSITIPTRPGYKFLGYWDTSATSGGTQYYTSTGASARTWNKTSNTTLFARWELIDYSISYTLNGGSHGENHPTTATYNEVINISNPTREGYTFDGWSASGLSNTAMTGTSSSLSKWNGKATKNTYFANLTTTNNGKVSLTANWKINKVIATLKYLNGTSDGTASAEYVSSGTKLGLPEELSRTGYEFKGWSLTPNNTGVYYDSTTDWNDVKVSVDNRDVCISDANAGDIYFNLYAIWEANEYMVTLDQQGGGGGTTRITATYDSAMPSITIPSKFGHTFNGYFNKVSDGTKYYNADGTSARNWDKANSATLYAQWTPYSYKLTLNGNGGTTANDQAVITISDSYTSNLKLQNKPFTRAGYIFKGWSTTQNGNVEYLDGENYSSLITSNPTSITLYAQWEDTWANHASSSLKTTEINGVTYNVIASAEDLAYLSKQSISSTLLGKYIQTADIDLSDYTWLPIGSENAFCGEYLGQGYKITGLHTSNAVDAKGVYLQTYGGLFGKLGENSTTDASANIVGVYITDCLVYGQDSGAIAGFSDVDSVNVEACIEACILENVKIYGDTTASFVGSSSDGQIKDCLLISSNISTANATTRGFYTGTMTIKSCYFVENNSAIRFTGESSDYSNWIEDVFMYPLPSIIVWFPNN